MINEKVFLRRPIKFSNKCTIYPPSVNEVVDEDLYGYFVKTLTMSQEEIQDLYVEKNITDEPLPPMDFLLLNVYQDKKVEALTKKAFYFFIKEEVTFLYDLKKIIIGDMKEALKTAKSINDLRIINEEDFFDFQNLIREACGIKKVEKPDPDEDPRVARIKAKARYRDRIKAKQAQKNGLNLSVTLAALCCMGIGLNPLNIGEISYATLSVLTNYYQEKEKYETDIKTLLAGGDSKKIKPKYWIRNIEE